ncbi:MAG: Uma2 family endonuclease [Planctomycetes bacterium]|nr:Uma2 family endonuclease [Planctomycetota bacterium]
MNFTTTRETVYPDSDGKPMADNTLQFRWIVTLQGGLDALFRDDPNVFVAGDLLWYPVEGEVATRMAPDVMVVFGRPKGDRRSYQQWKEDNVAPQVVFEVISPGNSLSEMVKKLRFYERHGVEELYTYDPELNQLEVWVRKGESLQEVDAPDKWASPRLGVRFEIAPGDLRVLYPDGRPFLSFVELFRRAEEERKRAEEERRRADEAHQRAERLAQRLRSLGVDPAKLE